MKVVRPLVDEEHTTKYIGGSGGILPWGIFKIVVLWEQFWHNFGSFAKKATSNPPSLASGVSPPKVVSMGNVQCWFLYHN